MPSLKEDEIKTVDKLKYMLADRYAENTVIRDLDLKITLNNKDIPLAVFNDYLNKLITDEANILKRNLLNILIEEIKKV